MPKNNPSNNSWDITQWNDPEFWRSQGIEPTIINPDNPESIESGMKQVTDTLTNIFQDDEGDKTNDK